MIGPADVPAIMVLKDAAGWNQTGQDWLNLMELAPEGCFGMEADGRMAATTTVVCYGRELAWIGMVLTHPECRGRGYARQLMEHALDYTDRMGMRTVKLDATDMGYPLYTKLGFVDECAIERWGRPAGEPAPGEVSFMRAELPFELDRLAFGTDRSAYIRLLMEGEWTAGPESYAMSRPGTRAQYFGPCVSRTRPDCARTGAMVPVAPRHGGHLLGPSAGQPGLRQPRQRIRIQAPAAPGENGAGGPLVSSRRFAGVRDRRIRSRINCSHEEIPGGTGCVYGLDPSGVIEEPV